MHKLFLWVQLMLLLSALPIYCSSIARLQLQIPEEDLLLTDTMGINYMNDGEAQNTDAGRVRDVLKTILSLNDVDLKSLFKGTHDISSLGKTNSISNNIFLRGSDYYLQKKSEDSSISLNKDPLTNDYRAATTEKQIRRLLEANTYSDLQSNVHKKHHDSHREETDSLLRALENLSMYREEVEPETAKPKNKGRRNHGKKRKRNRLSSHRKSSIPYSYWLRSGECPKTADGISKLYCPSPTEEGDWKCIEDVHLCDGRSHCPGHEDEDPHTCLFFNALRNHIDSLESYFLLSQRTRS